jgi:hypothetical protein
MTDNSDSEKSQAGRVDPKMFTPDNPENCHLLMLNRNFTKPVESGKALKQRDIRGFREALLRILAIMGAAADIPISEVPQD